MSFLKDFRSSITNRAISFRCLANTIAATSKTFVTTITMKLINLQSQSKHAASTVCKNWCARFHNQYCTCVALQCDGAKTLFASNMQCNYYLPRKILIRTIAYTCAEVAPLMHARMHRIAARGWQILHKNAITFLRFLQSRIKHCCMNDATSGLNLAQKPKSQFSKKNIFDTHFDAESLCTHRNLSLCLVQIGCESIMNASCITFDVAAVKLIKRKTKVV